MPAPRGKLTDFVELAAYVAAHVAGIAWGTMVTPMIFRSLVAQGFADHIRLVALVLAILSSIVVLLLVLILRRAMMGSGAPPPPADRPAPSPKFADTSEIGAYVLAHGAGIAFGFTVNPMIYRSLITQGHVNLMPFSIVLSIAMSLVVLLLFLFLRKAMAKTDAPS
jgi:hypothetical protein